MQEEAEGDYAAAADSFADRTDEDDHEGQDVSSSEESEEESSHSEEEEGSVGDQAENDEDDDDEVEEEGEEEEEEVTARDIEPPKSATGEPCTFDLRNLLAMNAHQINVKQLYSNRNPVTEDITIPSMQIMATTAVDEALLLTKAVDGCTQLVEALWQLPKEKSDAGPMVVLPSFDDSNIPRALVSR
jgi:hypothetical protein